LDEFDDLGVAEHGAWGRYENILKITYEGHDLKIETQNHAQAIVIYGKSVGFAERHAVVEDLPDEIKAMLSGIEDEPTRNTVLELHNRLTKLAVEHEVTLGEIETMESLLAHNKLLLREERGKVWSLKSENERLKAQAGGANPSGSDWLRSALGGKASSGKTALEENCEKIGLNPGIISTDPELVLTAAKSMRKVWARRLHPDVSEEDGEALKEINAAVDAIIGHFE
jgi:hypothetical protein